MEKGYDLCSGRDGKGRVYYTALPAGVARTGIYVRLVGGVFIQVERIIRCGSRRSPVLSAAAEVLERVWEDRRNV